MPDKTYIIRYAMSDGTTGFMTNNRQISTYTEREAFEALERFRAFAADIGSGKTFVALSI